MSKTIREKQLQYLEEQINIHQRGAERIDFPAYIIKQIQNEYEQIIKEMIGEEEELDLDNYDLDELYECASAINEHREHCIKVAKDNKIKI